ncbi:hypothetical protein FEM03_07805 [Phragmitibacter flavus]|uniref:Uncharacterized protein n=1 Tax=Phragmitibacter flavus TaxID=2576071 RepID=A0A5R8KGK2_9BACT|nr:hypothetical protein [Phragmitibacter flavus]TLD71422.1 hypothetical protein FEM03_07805 [Phragmitibacter flavus]
MPEYKKPSVDQLKKALEIAEKIKVLETQLAEILGSSAPVAKVASAVQESAPKVKKVKAPKAVKGVKKKRELSPEAREKIAAAQRARWAKTKKTK